MARDQASLAAFESGYSFGFDAFQRSACEAIIDGQSVLVAAPTGSGKTVVGEFAAWLAVKGGGKTFYTTPIKALSNQKFADLSRIHGPENVGLLTGDNSINGDAPVVVMTTEVLRNMIYEDSPDLHRLEFVVLDEVHYLQDRYRGAVWEEVLIHLPVDVKIISLSATVSNAEEFAEWMQTLRGRTEVIIEDHRPIEIKHWFFVSDELLPMFVQAPGAAPIPNQRARTFERNRRDRPGRPGRGGHRDREKRARIPRRTEVIERLASEDMLPAIYFLFSRKGCEAALQQCLADNITLTDPQERREIRAYAQERTAELSAAELDILGYDRFISALTRGVAAHHAGMIPPFKETVEKLFNRGLIKMVFATETLALGINMPARSVVIESLMKFTGEKHEQITPGQYTQLAGRAGRRGIDVQGHCVVLFQRFIDFDAITRLATTRTYPLQSSFAPSYNMAVNLVQNYDRGEADHLVNSSFAQFQADRDVVKLESDRGKQDAQLAFYQDRMQCELGDFPEYWKLYESRRKSLSGAPAQRTQAIGRTFQRFRRGDVIEVLGGRRRGRHLILEVSSAGNEQTARVTALSADRSVSRFGPAEVLEPPIRIGKLQIPKGFRSGDPAGRRALARRIGSMDAMAAIGSQKMRKVEDRDSALAEHPCHLCPELSRHIYFGERASRLERELAGIERRISKRSGTLARRFEKVLEVLEHFGCVEDWTLTTKGEILRRVYNESDLLVVECLQAGILDDLMPAELASIASTFVYETRGPEVEVAVRMPTRRSAVAFDKIVKMWESIHRDEADHGIELTREPDGGFAEIAYGWASGWPLDQVLGEEDPAGDFVRSTKQLIDLLKQLEPVTPSTEVAERIGEAIEALQRGVVAYSSLEVPRAEEAS